MTWRQWTLSAMVFTPCAVLAAETHLGGGTLFVLSAVGSLVIRLAVVALAPEPKKP